MGIRSPLLSSVAVNSILIRNVARGGDAAPPAGGVALLKESDGDKILAESGDAILAEQES